MRFYVGVTDHDWYRFLASKADLAEVNFWKPSPDATFKALQQGEPFLFKLHAPWNFIVGGGFFTRFLRLPVSMAWGAFGEANGARSLREVQDRITKYRHGGNAAAIDPQIGCIMLAEPFFFPKEQWLPAGQYFPAHTQVGKTYDAASENGSKLWREVQSRLEALRALAPSPGPALVAATQIRRYGDPITVMPRLGQGIFRTLVTDVYARRCSMTGERALPTLEAAHIKPYSRGGEHELQNGLLLRCDLHRLFDKGYVTVDPGDKRIVVSRRLKDEFDNGKEYYPLHGRQIAIPVESTAIPSREYLAYHSENVFR